MARSHPHRLLLGAMVAFVGFSAYLIAPASVSPLVVERFGVDGTAVGAAISATYLGWLLFQLPSGLLMDRYDNRALLQISVAGFVVAAGGGAFTESYVGFLVSRFIAGTAAGVLWGVGANVVGTTFPHRRRDLATGIFVASGPLGLAVGQFASPLLAEEVGLRATFPTYAVISLLGYALFHGAASDTVRRSQRVRFRALARSIEARPILLLSFSALCGNAAWLFVNSWMPTYGVGVLSLSLPTVGALSSLAPLAGALARGSGGLSADRIGRRATIAGSLFLVVPVVAAFSATPSAVSFGLVLLTSGFLLQLSVGVYYVYVRELTGEALSATGLSVVTSFQLLGGLVAPIAGGLLVETASWGTAFFALAATAVVGAGAVLCVPTGERSSSTRR